MPTTTFVTLTDTSCCMCGVVFAVPAYFLDKRREDGTGFYCPNGHSLKYTVTETQKLRDELAATKARLDQRDARIVELRACTERQERRINGYKGVTTRLKRRIQAGRCPCCSHEFKDLGRHMKNQHPEWNPDAHAEALAAKDGSNG